MLLASSCGAPPAKQKISKIYTGLFDTVITLTVDTSSQEEFEKASSAFESEMGRLNKLFDIYNSYEGINNLKTINDSAGESPVKADQSIIELVGLGKEAYENTGGAVNIALGPVLKLWHEARDSANAGNIGRIPAKESLTEAFKLCGIGKVALDKTNSTVFLEEKGMSLDVGAVAKGFATQKAADKIKEAGDWAFLIDSGGNVLCDGKPRSNNGFWVVAIQDPKRALGQSGGDGFYDTLKVESASCVTSGAYQRFFVADGKRLGHIIDPKTLEPASLYDSVTVICSDSGIADELSTALFIMPVEDGKALAAREGAEAIWIMPDGSFDSTSNYRKYSNELIK